MSILNLKQFPLFRFIAYTVLVAFVGMLPASPSYAQVSIVMPAPGQMIHITSHFEPPQMVGLKVDLKDPFTFNFIMDQGEKAMSTPDQKEEFNKIIKYFLVALAMPNKDMWVNLSPYESTRIIPQVFGQTEMGRDLLAQDYILKQFTASLMYPEDGLGKAFWSKVYGEAQSRFGTTDINVNTFNKVWIVADHADIYQKGDTALLVKSHLKVMLEQDFMAIEKNQEQFGNAQALQAADNNDKTKMASQIVREIIIPAIEKEVNDGKSFAAVRQAYGAEIMATWFKRALRQSLLGQVFADKSKIAGQKVSDPKADEKIYQQYLKAYKKGVFNYIKEDATPDGQIIPRKYFSGGELPIPETAAEDTANVVQVIKPEDAANNSAMKAEVNAAMEAKQTRRELLARVGLFAGAGAAAVAFSNNAEAKGLPNLKKDLAKLVPHKKNTPKEQPVPKAHSSEWIHFHAIAPNVLTGSDYRHWLYAYNKMNEFKSDADRLQSQIDAARAAGVTEEALAALTKAKEQAEKNLGLAEADLIKLREKAEKDLADEHQRLVDAQTAFDKREGEINQKIADAQTDAQREQARKDEQALNAEKLAHAKDVERNRILRSQIAQAKRDAAAALTKAVQDQKDADKKVLDKKQQEANGAWDLARRYKQVADGLEQTIKDRDTKDWFGLVALLGVVGAAIWLATGKSKAKKDAEAARAKASAAEADAKSKTEAATAAAATAAEQLRNKDAEIARLKAAAEVIPPPPAMAPKTEDQPADEALRDLNLQISNLIAEHAKETHPDRKGELETEIDRLMALRDQLQTPGGQAKHDQTALNNGKKAVVAKVLSLLPEETPENVEDLGNVDALLNAWATDPNFDAAKMEELQGVLTKLGISPEKQAELGLNMDAVAAVVPPSPTVAAAVKKEAEAEVIVEPAPVTPETADEVTARINADIEKNKAEILRIGGQIDHLKNDIKDYVAARTYARPENVQSWQDRIDRANQQIADKNEQIQGLISENERLSTELAAHLVAVAKAAAIQEKQETLSSLQRALSVLEKEAADAQDLITRWSHPELVNEKESAINTQQEIINRRQPLIDDLKNRIEQLNNEIAALQGPTATEVAAAEAPEQNQEVAPAEEAAVPENTVNIEQKISDQQAVVSAYKKAQDAVDNARRYVVAAQAQWRNSTDEHVLPLLEKLHQAEDVLNNLTPEDMRLKKDEYAQKLSADLEDLRAKKVAIDALQNGLDQNKQSFIDEISRAVNNQQEYDDRNFIAAKKLIAAQTGKSDEEITTEEAQKEAVLIHEAIQKNSFKADEYIATAVANSPVKAKIDSIKSDAANIGAKSDVGGINLSDEHQIINIKVDGAGMPLPPQFQNQAMTNLNGLTSVIRSIAPVTPENVPALYQLVQ